HGRRRSYASPRRLSAWGSSARRAANPHTPDLRRCAAWGGCAPNCAAAFQIKSAISDQGPFHVPGFVAKAPVYLPPAPPNLPAENSPRQSTTRKGPRSADDTRTATSPPRRVHPSQWSRLRRARRSEEHTSELQSRSDLVCRLLLEK